MPLPQALPTIGFYAKRTAPGRFMTSLQASPHRFYAQGYGGGEGDPKGENPQSQGSNPSADIEHPGPPPPAPGIGTGGGPTKANERNHNTQENESSGGSGSGSTASTSGAQPKIYNAEPPKQPSKDVQMHNEELDKRNGASQSKATDDEQQKVEKGFWSGHGGADRNP